MFERIRNLLRSKFGRKKPITPIQSPQSAQLSPEDIALRRAQREAAENAALSHITAGGRRGEVIARQVLIDSGKAVIAHKLAQKLNEIKSDSTRWNQYLAGGLEVTHFKEACKQFPGKNSLQVFLACHEQLTDPKNENHVRAMALLHESIQKFSAGRKSISSIEVGKLSANLFSEFIREGKIRL